MLCSSPPPSSIFSLLRSRNILCKPTPVACCIHLIRVTITCCIPISDNRLTTLSVLCSPFLPLNRVEPSFVSIDVKLYQELEHLKYELILESPSLNITKILPYVVKRPQGGFFHIFHFKAGPGSSDTSGFNYLLVMILKPQAKFLDWYMDPQEFQSCVEEPTIFWWNPVIQAYFCSIQVEILSKG